MGERWCVVVLARALPHARRAAHKNCRQRRYASELPPPPPIPNLGRWDSRGGARRARGPSALGGRARFVCVWGGGATLASLCARLERVQGPRNGSSAKASVAALGAAHGVERPPPAAAEGTRRRSWPRRRWLSIREEVGTRILRNLGSDGLEVMFVSIWVTVLTHTAYSCFRLSSSRAKHCSQLVVPFRFDLRNLTSSGPRVGTSGGGTSSSEGRFLSAVASLACLSDI